MHRTSLIPVLAEPRFLSRDALEVQSAVLPSHVVTHRSYYKTQSTHSSHIPHSFTRSRSLLLQKFNSLSDSITITSLASVYRYFRSHKLSVCCIGIVPEKAEGMHCTGTLRSRSLVAIGHPSGIWRLLSRYRLAQHIRSS